MRKAFLVAALLLIAPWPALAKQASVVFTCGGFHFVRDDGTGSAEIGSATFGIRNLDLRHPMTWRRLTIRNLFGDVVHDSGPATGIPLPVNTDIPGGLDVTTVPPGAGYYLTTNFIWGNQPIPGPLGQGNNITVLIEVAAANADLAEVNFTTRERQLFLPFDAPAFQGPIRARQGRLCTPMK